MRQSKAWIVQIRSDFAAGDQVYLVAASSTYCQAIAKYQQTVEKSVKAMVAAVNDLGIEFTTITPSHLPSQEITALLLLRRAIDNASVEALARLFGRYRKEVESLCHLAPRWPEKGQPFILNTEYPYQVPNGWSAPAVADTFREKDVANARRTAWAFHHKAIDFTQAVRLGRS